MLMNLPKLTHKEEEIMHVIWKLKKAFVKEIAEHLEEDLHYNTVSTMVRNLEEKQFVSYEAFGKTHRYFPLVEKEVYFRRSFLDFFYFELSCISFFYG